MPSIELKERLAEVGLGASRGSLSGPAVRRRTATRGAGPSARNRPKLLLADRAHWQLDQETGREIIELLFGSSASEA